MLKKFILIASALFSAFALFGQEMPQLPNDPEVRVGTLENGMTYYIRHNDKPEQRAEFYLVTDVGAIQEGPGQDGLAHFLEHMCFNGTKNFPEKGILEWLQSIGASFGGNVNASTGVEQTIYMLNNIPLVRPTVVDTCILIMHDYSHFVSNDPVEVDKERGVIIEEKRSRNTASWRTFEKSMPYLYGDSKYNGCNIIGSEETLRTFSADTLVDFYRTWYRPDLQALIVVGDVDVDEVESKIISTFADIPVPVNPRQKEMHKVPDNVEPIVGILTDPEDNSIGVNVVWKSEATPEELNSTIFGMMVDLIEDVIASVMNERFNDIASAPDAPFINARLGIYKFTETMEGVNLDVTCKEGRVLEGYEAALTEMERMKRFGFSDAEFERAKTKILSRYESAANSADTRKNSEFVYPIIYHFFDNEPYMVPAVAYEYAQQIMSQLSAAVVNQMLAELIGNENIVVIYTAPEREGLTHPTETELTEVLKKVENTELEAAEGEDIPEAFLDPAKLKGAKVKKTGTGLYGSTVLYLSNGVKAILLPTDYEKDKISFNIRMKGGKSLIDDEDLYSMDSNIWSLYIRNSGISEFPSTIASKMLAGKRISVSPYVNNYTHGVSGSSNRKDLETAFQLAYLYFADPRFDAAEYQLGIDQIEQILPNLVNTPNFKLSQALYDTAFDSPRAFQISEDVLEKASLETLEAVYRSLFKDVAGATITMVGDFDLDEAEALICKYVGSLPKGKKATDWSYRGDGFVSGKVVNDFRTTMTTPKVTVLGLYSFDEPYTVAREVHGEALSYILDMIYTRTLREDEGGTYGASAYASSSTEPHPQVALQIYYETNEEQADKLRELALAGLQDLADNGPTADDFDKTVKNLEKNIPESRLRNSYWSNALVQHELFGVEDYIAEYEAAVKALTPEDVQQLAKDLLASGNCIEIIMRPE